MRTKTSKLTHGANGLVGIFFALTIGLPGALGGCIEIPNIDAGGCIRTCGDDNNVCMDEADSECPRGDACMSEVEYCFDGITTCSQDCTGCEDEPGGCNPWVDEDQCADHCAERAKTCTDALRECLEVKEICIEADTDAAKACFSGDDGLIDCTADCVDEVESKLRQIG